MYLLFQTADSIADLVDGYCSLVNNSEISLWDRSNTPGSSSTVNSLDKSNNFLKHDSNIKSKEKNDNSKVSSVVSNIKGSKIVTKQNDQQKNTPKLSEDYAEIGLVDEEGDYSTPAGRF